MPGSVTTRLREHNAATHERVEATLDLLDPALSARRLASVLARFAGFWFAIEAGVDAWALAHPDTARAWQWRERRRSDILRADLMTLRPAAAGVDALPRCRSVFPDAVLTDAQVLGWLYVSEGSTLGGAVIARAARNQPGPLSGVRTFAPYPGGPGRMWRAYVDGLTAWVGENQVRADAVVDASGVAFDALADWLEPLIEGRAA